MKGNLIIISSPSGGGKGTLIREILAQLPRVGYSVSYTTRRMRDGERDGADYFFISKDQFAELIARDEFLEYAEVHGNFYGTSINQVSDEISQGNDVILEIDVQGAANVRKKLPEAVSIFIMPPSFAVLRDRLTARATETHEDLALRLKNSGAEVREYENFDFVVINEDLDRAVGDLKIIILSERLRRNRQSEAIQGILDSFDV